nr:Arabinose import ATP-binding protein AraG [Klebsiella pneumoniae]
MTVAENIYLGQLPHRGGIVNRSLLNYEARLQLEHLGLDIDPETPLKYLSIGQWQMVEIAKALARNAKIIAFDEPTSSLSAREIDNLFRVIRELREEGRVIIYVSHRMEEILPSAMPSPSLKMAATFAPLTICRASATTPRSVQW